MSLGARTSLRARLRVILSVIRDREDWRAVYYEGGRTYPLTLGEARDLAHGFGGHLAYDPLPERDGAPAATHLAPRADVVEVLRDCEDYLDNRADADFDGERTVPNKAMILLERVREVLGVKR